jgi:hypothetical protein
MHEIIMSTYKNYQLGMKVMIGYNNNKFKHKSECKCNNMSHTCPFGIAFGLLYFWNIPQKVLEKIFKNHDFFILVF